MDRKERTTLHELLDALVELTRDLIKVLQQYLAESQPATKLRGDLMADFPLTSGDDTVIALVDNDAVTGAVVTIDPGSVTAVLSDTTDSVSVDPSGTFVTLVTGPNVAAGKTITVNATVGGLASQPWVGTYDVVAAVVTPDATVLTGTFGAEEPPVDLSAVPAGFTKHPETGELLDANGNLAPTS